jgi:TonB family protein
MKILLLHSFLFIQLFGYASRVEEGFVLRTDTVIPNSHKEMPVTFPGPRPKYPGGEEQLLKDIQDNLVYPELEKSKGIQGTVMVEFYIEIDGSISGIEVVRGIQHGENLNKAAVQAVKKLKNFIPDKDYTGVPMRIAFTLPVRFKLPEETDINPK